MATQIVLGTQEYPRVAEVNQMVKMTKFMTNIDEEADKWQKWSKKWNSGRRDEEPKQGGGQMADKWQTWCEKWNSGRRDEQPKQGGGQMADKWQTWCEKWNSGRRDEQPKQGGGQMADKWRTNVRHGARSGTQGGEMNNLNKEEAK